jgi:hypothetical protein
MADAPFGEPQVVVGQVDADAVAAELVGDEDSRACARRTKSATTAGVVGASVVGQAQA